MYLLLLSIVVVYSPYISAEYIHFKYLDSEYLINPEGCVSKSCSVGPTCNQNCTGIQMCLNGNQLCDTVSCGGETPYCDSQSNTCVAEQGMCTPSYQFQCMEAGAFPDPSNCGQYYCCNGANDPQDPAPIICGSGYTYDPTIGQCTLASTQCSSVTCIQNPTRTQCDQLAKDPYIYYMCMKDTSGSYAPLLFNCESGLFDPTNCACQPTTMYTPLLENVAATACSSSNSSTTTTTINPDVNSTTSTMTPTPPPDTIHCPLPFEFYALSETDCYYCYCTLLFYCDIRNCFSGTHFDIHENRCIPGQCS